MKTFEEEKRIMLLCFKKIGIWTEIKENLLKRCCLPNIGEEKDFIKIVLLYSYYMQSDNRFNKSVVLSLLMLMKKQTNDDEKNKYLSLFWRYIITSENYFCKLLYKTLCDNHVSFMEKNEGIDFIIKTVLELKCI